MTSEEIAHELTTLRHQVNEIYSLLRKKGILEEKTTHYIREIDRIANRIHDLQEKEHT